MKQMIPEKNSPAQHCDDLLVQSCGTYREMEIIYAGLIDQVSEIGPASAEKTTVSLTDLRQRAQRIDSVIAENLGVVGQLSVTTRNLLQQREEILFRLHRFNQTLTHKAANIQSLIRHEIAGMAKNRNALQGYKPPEIERKCIIRSSF